VPDVRGIADLAHLAVAGDVDAGLRLTADRFANGALQRRVELPRVEGLAAVRANRKSTTSFGRGRLPTCVVRMRSVLVCICAAVVRPTL
jgi:hypothetical protein